MAAMHIDQLPFTVKREPLTEEESGCRCTFYMSRSALDKICENGPRWKFYCSDLVPQAVLNPCSILIGLKRTEFTDGYCYASPLELRYNNYGQLEQSPQDRLFLVFVKKFMGLTIFDWEFRKRSKGNPNLPANFNEDFDSHVWQKQ